MNSTPLVKAYILIHFDNKLQDYDEDDFYAEILKDDIIKLDESPMSDTPNMSPLFANNSVAEQKYEEPVEAIVSQSIPLQGTASRRIRLRKQEAINSSSDERALGSLKTNKKDYIIEKTESCAGSLEQPAKRSNSSARITVSRHLLFVAFVFMTLMVLFFIVIGRFATCQMCRI